jgi:hypothetical protein
MDRDCGRRDHRRGHRPAAMTPSDVSLSGPEAASKAATALPQLAFSGERRGTGGRPRRCLGLRSSSSRRAPRSARRIAPRSPGRSESAAEPRGRLVCRQDAHPVVAGTAPASRGIRDSYFDPCASQNSASTPMLRVASSARCGAQRVARRDARRGRRAGLSRLAVERFARATHLRTAGSRLKRPRWRGYWSAQKRSSLGATAAWATMRKPKLEAVRTRSASFTPWGLPMSGPIAWLVVDRQRACPEHEAAVRAGVGTRAAVARGEQRS